jgi:acyl-CoA dehydrogenase
MLNLLEFLSWVLLIGGLFYFRINLLLSLLTLYAYILLSWSIATISITTTIILTAVLSCITVPLLISPLRRKCFTKHILQNLAPKMPKISATEQEALNAGTVWFEAELFSGQPNWKNFFNTPAARLSKKEQDFLDTKVTMLCSMINDWEIQEQDNIPANIWSYLKQHKFFAIVIHPEYGGLHFSAYAHSEILSKIASCSITVAITVAVPNSLGPAELLQSYGTKEQKDYYLPKLAIGEEIPCFALTEPEAGSDATSITSQGIICSRNINNQATLGVLLNWNKRYITLAPIATVLGLAFKLYDPDNILGRGNELGITCALIPTNTAGITIGARHKPLTAAFLNGPTIGQDVFIPLDYIIGGESMIGQGWKMLVECLSTGRAISLPSSAVGCAKMAAATSGAYAKIRKQFKQAIGKFEGIQEPLARIASNLYIADAARQITVACIDAGQRPAILGAILKYHLTELSRKISLDAMDLHGGKGIMRGASNYLAQGFINSPIGVTVEGANILTRCLIIFGQGAIRCHPYLKQELDAILDTNKQRGLINFDRALLKHLGHILSNLVRCTFLSLTAAKLAPKVLNNTSPHIKSYIQNLSLATSCFALVSDIALIILGGKLKTKEFLSGRFADMLSMLYLSATAIKHFNDQNNPAELEPVVTYAVQNNLYLFWQAFQDILDNFPHPLLAKFLAIILMPYGRPIKKPNDKLTTKVAILLQSQGIARDLLLNNTYLSGNINNPVVKLEHAFKLVTRAEPIEAKMQQAIKEKVFASNDFTKILAESVQTSLINHEEAELLQEARAAVEQAITVDSFIT